MSVSYSSHLVVGVKLDQALFKQVHIEETTKYNEDTGNPYQKQVKTERFYLGSAEIEDFDEETLDGEAYVRGMSIFGFGNDRIIGITIAETENASELNDLSAKTENAKRSLQSLGIVAPAAIFLIHRCSA